MYSDSLKFSKEKRRQFQVCVHRSLCHVINKIFFDLNYNFKHSALQPTSGTLPMVTSSKHPPESMEETTTSLQNIVPACPQGLCINKTDFLKQDFSVDNFFIEVMMTMTRGVGRVLMYVTVRSMYERVGPV